MNIKDRITCRPGSLSSPLKNVFRRALKLELDGRRYVFGNPEEFDFAIRSRTAVPAARIGALYFKNEQELGNEAQTLVTLEQDLKAALQRHAAEQDTLVGALREIGIMVISKDQGWRLLFDSFIQAGVTNDSYTAILIDRYLEYLAARRDAIGSISLLKASAAGAQQAPSELATGTVEPLAAKTEASASLKRLPQGRRIKLKLVPGRDLTISLARHTFSLSHNNHWSLIARNGERYLLHSGPNSIGRSRRNHISVDSTLKAISRQHLIAEPLGKDEIAITDTSACGTYIVEDSLARTGEAHT